MDMASSPSSPDDTLLTSRNSAVAQAEAAMPEAAFKASIIGGGNNPLPDIPTVASIGTLPATSRMDSNKLAIHSTLVAQVLPSLGKSMDAHAAQREANSLTSRRQKQNAADGADGDADFSRSAMASRMEVNMTLSFLGLRLILSTA